MVKSKELLKRILDNIPEWMDLRKRTDNSIAGKYFTAVTSEQNNVYDYFEDFKKDFFLLNYKERYDEILYKVKVARINTLDDVLILNSDLVLTTDYKKFFKKSDEYALRQNELIFLPIAYDKDYLEYKYKDSIYKQEIETMQIWNIFDEFAKFASLERYENESNKELANRIYQNFQNLPNSTDEGLKNAISNALINYSLISDNNIKIERPDGQNIYLKSDDEIVYNMISNLNRDRMKDKLWSMSYWKNDFKDLYYIPNKWDVSLPTYQNGTGQGDNLKPLLVSSLGDLDMTNLEVTGYKMSKELIENYIKRQNLVETIPLSLTKYSDELIPKKVSWQIQALPVTKINPDDIIINSYKLQEGIQEVTIKDIVIDDSMLDKEEPGKLKKNSQYKIMFKPKSRKSEMQIFKANLSYDNKVENLLVEDENFGFSHDGIFRNKSIALNIDKVQGAMQYNGFKNTLKGIDLEDDVRSGEMLIDITGMGGREIFIDTESYFIDYTLDKNYVKTQEMKAINSSVLTSINEDSQSVMTIEMDCVDFSFEFFDSDDPEKQGSVSVQYEVDDVIDIQNSGLWTCGKKINVTYPKLTHVKVTITKVGMNPISIGNIKATRYILDTNLTCGKIMKTINGYFLPPVEDDVKNELTISLTNLSGKAPTIKHIRIGNLSDKEYVTKVIDTKDKEMTLDIDAFANVVLYEIIDGNDKIHSLNYSTAPIYVNKNQKKAEYLPIDLKNFEDIKEASVKFHKINHKGNICYALKFEPNDKLSHFMVEGKSRKLIEKKPLSKYLITDKDLYISSNVNGFITKEHLLTLNRDSLPKFANLIEFVNLPDNSVACFNIDKEAKIKEMMNTINHDFSSVYIALKNIKNSTSYNNQSVIKNTTKTIFSNNFYPIISFNELYLYKITQVSDNASVIFADNKNWSLGSNQDLIIRTKGQEINKKNYNHNVNNLNVSFSLSNNMPLKHKYLIAGREDYLARYIITPPDDMEIAYKVKDEVGENILVKDDLFNKLYYSNIYNILTVIDTATNETIMPSKYDYLKEEGIIVWKDNSLAGKKLEVVYKYKEPIAIEFSNIKYLYDRVQNSIDAYKAINKEPIIFEGIKNGDSKTIYIDGIAPDKILVKSSNPNFDIIIEKNKFIAKRTHDNDAVIVKPGYYYEDDKEYYLFENDHKEVTTRHKNIKLSDIEQAGELLYGRKQTTNYIKNSILNNGDKYTTVCAVDFADNKNYEGLSTLNSFSACSSYQLWNEFNMKIDIVNTSLGYGLHFKKENDNAYAILDITNYIDNKLSLHVKATGNINLEIGREVKARGNRFNKSILVESIAKIDRVEDDLTYTFDNLDFDYKYYLILQGEGVLDDIIITNEKKADFAKLHTTNAQKLGFNFKEIAAKNSFHKIAFNKDMNAYDGLEVANNNTVQTGSNVDYGLTLIKSFRGDFTTFLRKNTAHIKGYLIAQNDRAKITSQPIYINNPDSILSLHIKINDIVKPNYKDFKVSVYTKENVTEEGRRIYSGYCDNVIEINEANINKYLQIVVEIKKDKVINNIELYALYVENPNQKLSITRNRHGALVTKIYPTACLGNYALSHIEGNINNPEDILISVRGFRDDSKSIVPTKWYEYRIDEDLNIKGYKHIFEQYDLFQFKIEILNEQSNIRINNFVFKVEE